MKVDRKKIAASLKSKSGQGMTEYVIIICIVAIACLIVIGVFGTNIRNLFSTANSSLSQGKAQNATLTKGTPENVTINKLGTGGGDSDL